MRKVTESSRKPHAVPTIARCHQGSNVTDVAVPTKSGTVRWLHLLKTTSGKRTTPAGLAEAPTTRTIVLSEIGTTWGSTTGTRPRGVSSSKQRVSRSQQTLKILMMGKCGTVDVRHARVAWVVAKMPS